MRLQVLTNPLSGILLVDKPSGPGSRQVDRMIGRHFQVRKVGHVGTLDPLATGLLVLLLGEGTKLSQFLVGARKRYQATVELGRTTDTYDTDGETVETRSYDGISEDQVRQAVQSFLGRSQQVPPAYSAIKVDGIANYKRARRGETVELTPRSIDISEIKVLRMDLPQVQVEVLCSKGTYLRSLAHDLGHKLGCGGVLSQIRRVESEPFHLMHSTPLDQILERDPAEAASLVVPLEEALGHLTTVQATAALDARLRVGNLPEKRDLGPILDLTFTEGELIVLVGSTRIGIMKTETDSRNARFHQRPLSYVRVLEKTVAET